MIGDQLLPKLKARWPGRAMKFGGTDGPLVVFPAAHPEVGDAEIYDNGTDIIVSIGKFTHEHFLTCEDVIAFLEQLFADRIEFGRRTYVWSGPLADR